MEEFENVTEEVKVRKQLDEDFAPLTKEVISEGRDTHIGDLAQNDLYNYLLKCTDGMFEGKFFYINMTPEGELIGGVGDPSITMHIENAQLSPSHCEIKFDTSSLQYKLQDASSIDGTWVKVFDMDLYSENRK